MHTVTDYAPVVAAYIRKHGIAYWSEIFSHVEATMELTDEDWAALDSDGLIRWHRIVRNLKSNRVAIKLYSDIIQVDNGFATAQFAKDNNIEERTSKNRANYTPRTGTPRKPKINLDAKGEKAIRKVWDKHFVMLRGLYDSAVVLLDVRNPEMTVRDFGIKYNLMKYLTPTPV